MKYVAFLDVLGFKNKLKQLSQHEAENYIRGFSSSVYFVFNNHRNENVNGYIVSDSIILYTEDDKITSLESMLKIIEEICREEFTNHGVLIRGAISKGEFEKMPAVELPKLEKQLIVGQAYVDAYLLEDAVKAIGITLSDEVYEDLVELGLKVNLLTETINKKTHYVFRYITLDYLLDEYNLLMFVNLAKESNWLPHYYNTLYFSIANETNEKKVEQLFCNLESIISKGNYTENYKSIDSYISNAFKDDVIYNFKKRFLKHIRVNMFE